MRPGNNKSIMLDVAIAMIPATAYGVYQFGIKAALVILVTTVAACVLSEYVYETLMGSQSRSATEAPW